MSIPLKRATATTISLGFYVEDDGTLDATPIPKASIFLSQGATSAAATNNATVSNNVQFLAITAAETATAGPLFINAHEAGRNPLNIQCMILNENVYDALFGTGRHEI